MKIETEMMRGAGPTAVLQLLSGGEMYCYELVQTLAKKSNGIFKMGQSTLYPMLYNLEAKGLVKSQEKVVPSGRRRRYYRLTKAGKKKLSADRKQWSSLVEAMGALGLTRGCDVWPNNVADNLTIDGGAA